MRSLMRNVGWILLLVCVPLWPVLGNEDQATVLADDYLAQAGGSPEGALELMARTIIILTGDVEYLEWLDGKKTAKLNYYEDKIKREEPSFLDKLGNSSLFKILLFVAGVYVGVGAG